MPDFVITITIPSSKVAEYREAILRGQPNDEKSPDGSPTYTDAQWVKILLLRYARNMVIWGKQLLHEDAMAAADVSDIT